MDIRFDGRLQNYRSYMEDIIVELSSWENKQGIPMVYLLQGRFDSLFEKMPAFFRDMCRSAPMYGHQFDYDNFHLVQYLWQTLEGPATKALARKFYYAGDGQGLMFLLYDMYESFARNHEWVLDAKAIVGGLTVKYYGTEKKYSLDQYYNDLVQASPTIEMRDEFGAVNDAMLVLAYIWGIEDEELKSLCVSLTVTKTHLDSLEKFHHALKALATKVNIPVDSKEKRSKNNRQISANFQGRRGNRGRGKSRRTFQRCSANRHCRRRRSTRSNNGKHLLPPEIWNRLSNEQKRIYRRGLATYKSGRPGNGSNTSRSSIDTRCSSSSNC